MRRNSIVATIVVIAFCTLAIAPLVWHGLSSLKTASDVSRIPPGIFPEEVTLSNYEELFVRRPFAAYFLNSLVIASLATLLCLAAGALAAYRLVHLPPRLRSILAAGLLVLGFFPPIVFLFPVYELVQRLGAMNHPWALILAYAGLNLPMTIWLLAGYLQKIPRELEEAASIDGMTEFQAFRLIFLPLAAPAIATTGILVFIFCWNEFMFALTFMNLDTARTVTVGTATLSGAFAYQIPWGLLAAGVVVTALPLILLVVIFQRRIVEGLTAGSLK
jgi:multiple sugar transport system permease protein